MTLLYMSGRTVDPMNLRSADLDIQDIAWNLAHIARFTGSFPFHYSVAQHSILLSYRMEAVGHDREACLAGLLHDAAEYVLNDLSSEVKHHPLLAGYARIEHETSRMILATFGCKPSLLHVCKPFDILMYKEEDAVRRGTSRSIVQMLPATVYRQFLLRFNQLQEDSCSLSSPLPPL